MKILDWYIFKKFIGTFFYAIIVLAVISCVIDYSQKVEDFVRTKAPTGAILSYFCVFVPHITALLFPFFTFIAAIFFTSKLAYKSEIIVMLATGMSFNRFLRPYIIGAAFLGTISLLANHFLIPVANKSRIKFEHKYWRSAVTNSDQNLHLQLSNSLLIYVHDYNYTTNSGTFFTAEHLDGTRMTEKIWAESFSYDSVKKNWILKTVTIRKNDSMQETLTSLPELIRKYPLVPKDLKFREDIKETLTTKQLNEYIETQSLRGNENLSIFYVEKYRRTAEPFAAIILTVIAACVASRKIRGGSGFHIALGIVISVFYEVARKFTTTFAINAGLSTLVAVWIPNILFGLVAFWFYRKHVK